MPFKIVPRKFTVSDDVSYLGTQYDPRSPYPEKERVSNLISGGIGPSPGDPEPPKDWYFADFKFRKKITVKNNSASTITDAPVMIAIDFVSGKMNTNWSDIRFTAVDSYTGLEKGIKYLKEFSSTTKARFWIEVPTISASGEKACYIYYGNTAATNAENWGWMYASFNFETNEGLTWKENGVLENYGDSSGELRSNLSRIDFVGLRTIRETFVYKPMALGTKDFRLRVRTQFQVSGNTPMFAVSTSAEKKSGVFLMWSIGIAFRGAKLCFISSYGGTVSSYFGKNTFAPDNDLILEIKKIATIASASVRNNENNNSYENLPDSSTFNADMTYAHPVLAQTSTYICYGSCDLFLVMKIFDADPTYSIGSEETR